MRALLRLCWEDEQYLIPVALFYLPPPIFLTAKNEKICHHCLFSMLVQCVQSQGLRDSQPVEYLSLKRLVVCSWRLQSVLLSGYWKTLPRPVCAEIAI